jgi:hypothetical protein
MIERQQRHARLAETLCLVLSPHAGTRLHQQSSEALQENGRLQLVQTFRMSASRAFAEA